VKARPHATDATEIRRRFGELQAAALSDNGSDIARQVTVSTLARFDGVRLVARHAPSWVARNLPRADALAALVIRAERREHVADGAGALSLATRAGVRLVEGGPLRLPRRGRDPAG
jgi:hypothetical protein